MLSASRQELDSGGTTKRWRIVILSTGRHANNDRFDIPGAPAQSSLMDWLGTSAPLRMPPDSPLPPDDIQLIERWISAGALND